MIVVLARKTMEGSNNVISSDKERWIKAEEDHRENCFTGADYPVDKEVIAQVSLLLNNASRKKKKQELFKAVELVFLQLQWNRPGDGKNSIIEDVVWQGYLKTDKFPLTVW